MKKGIDYIGITASYLAHDGEGNFVMTLRGENCRDEQGVWDFGGGGIDFGDSAVKTIIKEIKEELDADVKNEDVHFLGYRDLFREQEGQETHWVSLQFIVQVNREHVKNNEPHKFDDIGWFRLDELPNNIHSTAHPMLEKFQAEIKEIAHSFPA